MTDPICLSIEDIVYQIAFYDDNTNQSVESTDMAFVKGAKVRN